MIFLFCTGHPVKIRKDGKYMEGKPKCIYVNKLEAAMKYVFPEIQGLSYSINKETGEESVTCNYMQLINYTNGTREIRKGAFDICVTCDSLSALTDDVWNELKRRFN